MLRGGRGESMSAAQNSDMYRLLEWLQNHLALSIGFPLLVVVLVWLLWVLLARRRGLDSGFSATQSIMDLTDSSALTPEERELVKKKLHERIRREVEEQDSEQDRRRTTDR